jgi:hypothetical protein
MVDENKLLEHFAKVLNVEIKNLDEIVVEKKEQAKPKTKSFKDFIKENKKQKPVEVVIEEEKKPAITLFDLIKEELAKDVEEPVVIKEPITFKPEPVPVVTEEVKRPKTLQEHMAENSTLVTTIQQIINTT